MKALILTTILLTLPLHAVVPEKADLGRSKKHVLRPAEREMKHEKQMQKEEEISQRDHGLSKKKLKLKKDDFFLHKE